MIIRQLKEKKFDALCSSLKMNAHTDPLEANYTVRMAINNTEYELRLQPERHNSVAILQALRINKTPLEPTYELITKGNILSALLEILIYQGYIK